MLGKLLRGGQALAMASVLLLSGIFATPTAAASTWIPAHFTCAGVSGIMADGNWTHYGAVGLFPAALSTYPFGTVLEDWNGQMWTVEDTGPAWSAWQNGRLRIDLYNYFTPRDCWNNFQTYDGWVRVRRYGWYGAWT
jgi:hypothetical protein